MNKFLCKNLKSHLPDGEITLEQVIGGHRKAYLAKISGKPYAVVKLFRGMDTWKRYYTAHEFFMAENLPSPRLIHTDRKLTTRFLCGGFLLVEEWIDGGDLVSHADDPQAVAVAAHALASLHKVRRSGFGSILKPFNKHFDNNSMINSIKNQINNLGTLVSESEKNRIQEKLCSGFMDYPWDRDYSLCHRDASPDNIMIRRSNDKAEALFIDLASVGFHFFFFDLMKLTFCLEELNPDSAKHFLKTYLNVQSHMESGEWEQNNVLYRMAFHLKSAAQYAKRSRERKRGDRRQKYLELAPKHTGLLLDYIK